MALQGYRGFATWEDVLAYARVNRYVCYHAPLDRAPRYVKIACVYVNGKIRLDPMTRDASKFTADANHLSRFLVRV